MDISIAIPNWNAFSKITEMLIQNEFEKDSRMYQRFYYGDYELDVVPYGEIAKSNDYIYWPPEEDIAMSVKGFSEVLSDSITVTIDGMFNIKIASLHGLFLLKFNAWLDRNLTTSKDAEDMSFILSKYYDANSSRNIHPEVYDMEPFDMYVAGAYWLAYDLIPLLNKSQIAYYMNCMKAETDKSEESRLINQILDHSYELSFDVVMNTLQTIISIFQKSLDSNDKI